MYTMHKGMGEQGTNCSVENLWASSDIFNTSINVRFKDMKMIYY